MAFLWPQQLLYGWAECHHSTRRQGGRAEGLGVIWITVRRGKCAGGAALASCTKSPNSPRSCDPSEGYLCGIRPLKSSCHPKRSLLVPSGAGHKSQTWRIARHPDPAQRLHNRAKSASQDCSFYFPKLCSSGATGEWGRLYRSVRKVTSARTHFCLAAE